jgi:hypothetical protein
MLFAIVVLLIVVAGFAGYRWGSVVATEVANTKAAVSADVAKVEGTAAKVVADIKK